MGQRLVGGLGLDHEDVHAAPLVPSPRDHHVEGGEVEVLVRRVDAPAAVHQGHPDGSHRAVEGEARQHGRGAGAVDARDVVGVGLVGGEDRGHDVDLLAEVVVEGGTHRAVDEARRQGRLLARPALAAEEPAGDLPGRVHPLLDVDGQGEEVDALSGRAGGAGDQDLRLTDRDDGRAVRQLRQLPGLQLDVLATDLPGGGDGIHLVKPPRVVWSRGAEGMASCQ